MPPQDRGRPKGFVARLRRALGGQADLAASRHDAREPDDELVLLACASCATLLGFDPDDEPNGEGPGVHLCGKCNRARNFDAMVGR
jgi:hypothetical protein